MLSRVTMSSGLRRAAAARSSLDELHPYLFADIDFLLTLAKPACRCATGPLLVVAHRAFPDPPQIVFQSLIRSLHCRSLVSEYGFSAHKSLEVTTETRVLLDAQFVPCLPSAPGFGRALQRV